MPSKNAPGKRCRWAPVSALCFEHVAVFLKMLQVPLEEAERHLGARRIGPGSSQTNDKTFLLLHNAASFQNKLMDAVTRTMMQSCVYRQRSSEAPDPFFHLA
jgi:hypothetical protein